MNRATTTMASTLDTYAKKYDMDASEESVLDKYYRKYYPERAEAEEHQEQREDYVKSQMERPFTVNGKEVESLEPTMIEKAVSKASLPTVEGTIEKFKPLHESTVLYPALQTAADFPLMAMLVKPFFEEYRDKLKAEAASGEAVGPFGMGVVSPETLKETGYSEAGLALASLVGPFAKAAYGGTKATAKKLTPEALKLIEKMYPHSYARLKNLLKRPEAETAENFVKALEQSQELLRGAAAREGRPAGRESGTIRPTEPTIKKPVASEEVPALIEKVSNEVEGLSTVGQMSPDQMSAAFGERFVREGMNEEQIAEVLKDLALPAWERQKFVRLEKGEPYVEPTGTGVAAPFMERAGEAVPSGEGPINRAATVGDEGSSIKGSSITIGGKTETFGPKEGSAFLRRLEEIRKPLQSESGQVELTPGTPQSPALDKIGGMVGEKPVKTGPGLKERTRFELTDRGAYLETFVKEARKLSKKEIKAEEDPYILFRNYAGRSGIVEAAHGELADILRPVRVYRDPLEKYLLANRALERAERDFKNPNSVTAEDAQQAINDLREQLGEKPFAAIEKVANDFYAWADRNILDPSREAGLISDDVYKEIKEKNKAWAPFNVIDYLDEVERLGSGPEVFSLSSQNVVKAMKGTEKQIQNPFVAVGSRLVNAVSTIERNRVGRSFVELRDKVKGFDELIVPMKQGTKLPEGMEPFSVFQSGKAVKYAIPEDVALSLKQMTRQELNLLTKIAQKTGAAFRAGATTLYFPFTLSNAVRDAYMAKMCSKYGFSVGDWLRGFFEASKVQLGLKSQLYQDFLKNKGGFSGYVGQMKTPKTGAKKLFESRAAAAGKVVVNPFEWISRASQAIELSPRLGIYRRTLKKGAGEAEAAFAARSGTIDFAKAGRTAKIVNMWVPFLNARVQGRLNLVQAFKDKPAASSFKALALAVVPGVTTYAWNRLNYPEQYDDIPQYVKDNYFVFVTGEGETEKGETAPSYLKIPKGDVGQIFYNPLEYALDYMWGKDNAGMIEFLTNWLSDISPVEFAREGEPSVTKLAAGTTPPMARVPLELGTGKNWYTGMDIIPRKLQGVEPELQYIQNTPELYKKIGQKLGISPMKLHYAMGGMLAGIGRTSFNPLEQMSAARKRFYDVSGGAQAEKVWNIIEQAEKSYATARLTAIRELVDRKKTPNQVKEDLRAYNKGALKNFEAIQKVGIPETEDIGKFTKQVTFSVKDWERLVQDARDELAGKASPLERRLSGKKRKRRRPSSAFIERTKKIRKAGG